MTIQELYDARAKAIHDARAILEQAKAEKRDNNAEELKRYDDFLAEARSLKDRITREESLAEEERALSQSQGRKTEPTPPGAGGETRTSKQPIVVEYRGHRFEFEPGSPGHERNTEAYRRGLRNYLRTGEVRDMSLDGNVSGGYLAVPEQLVAGLLKKVDDAVFMRQLATVYMTSAKTLGIRKRTTKASTFAWSTEVQPPTADTALAYGKKVLTPAPMTGEILVSRDLMRADGIFTEQVVLDELAINAGELQEQAFMTGSGSGQPLGIFTASTDGISTARDVSTGSTTSITADSLRTSKYTLKQTYRANARWLFHRDAISIISKLKDSQNQYLWQAGLSAGDPDRLLNIPVIESEWVPNTFTASQHVGMLADFRHYVIADAIELEIQRLNERHALENQVGFIGRLKCDGLPVLEEAFVRLKTAAS